MLQPERASYTQELARSLSRTKRAEERYRKLLEHSHEAIMMTRLDGTIVEANERWQEILGVPVSDLIGHRLEEFNADCRETECRCTRLSFENGDGSAGPIPFTSRVGGIVQMLVSWNVVAIEGESFVLLMGNDVTQTIESSRAMAMAEEKYGALVERIPDVIWSRRGHEATASFTTNAEKVLGESPAALRASHFSARLSRIHPDDVVAVRQAFDAYFLDGTTFDLEYRYRRKDGRWVWLHERTFPVTTRAGVKVAEGMISDVTARKRLEEDLRQSQKMEALGQLTGGIAHDFNNILATILATSELLIDALPADDPRREDAETIREAGGRAAALTRQLLAFSRRQVLEPRVLELTAAVSGVQRMLRSIIRENITFTLVPSRSVGCVRIDVGQLEQVIMNLVVNACDAMPTGGALTIETADDASTRSVLLRVRDNGHGMDKATQERIFEPFFTTKEKGRGTGLGLSTCYGIVEQSGGRILVESEVGCGTTFTISLPRVDAEPGSGPSVEAKVDVCGSESILLIEDDPNLCLVLRRLFEGRGYQVITAENATDAVEVALDPSVRIDIIVSDIVLPGAAGPNIVQHIRSGRPGLKAIFVSGYSDLAALGSDAVASLTIIEKPFRPEKILRAVRAELARA
jgi:PAS domain S-box-containing protein